MGTQAARNCAYCHTSHAWIWGGQKLKDGSKVYLDNAGHRWAGRRCPVCEKSRVSSAIRHDAFDRDMIFEQLVERGFEVKSKTHPVTVEKLGQTYQVGIRRARMDGANIVVESPADSRDDIVALLFESVRLVAPDQLKKMTIYSPQNPNELAGSINSDVSVSIPEKSEMISQDHLQSPS